MPESTKEKIPFDVRELEQMKDREFYLMVIGYEEREELAKIASKGSSPKQGLANLMSFEGALAEIISRKPSCCEFYSLGNLRSVTYENGNSVCHDIKNVYETFIFSLEEVVFQDRQPPVLKGVARHYNLHDDAVGEPLGQKLVLHMAKMPTYKETAGVMCL